MQALDIQLRFGGGVSGFVEEGIPPPPGFPLSCGCAHHHLRVMAPFLHHCLDSQGQNSDPSAPVVLPLLLDSHGSFPVLLGCRQHPLPQPGICGGNLSGASQG